MNAESRSKALSASDLWKELVNFRALLSVATGNHGWFEEKDSGTPVLYRKDNNGNTGQWRR